MTSDTTVVPIRHPNTIEDPLTAVWRSGAGQLLAQVVEVEAEPGPGRCRSGPGAPGHGRAAPGARARPAAARPSSRPGTPRLPPPPRLRQQPAGAAPQHGRQRILDRVGVAEWDNSVIAHRGVSLLREVLAGSSPASIRRLSHATITQFRP